LIQPAAIKAGTYMGLPKVKVARSAQAAYSRIEDSYALRGARGKRNDPTTRL
jgi:hypothetical protein